MAATSTDDGGSQAPSIGGMSGLQAQVERTRSWTGLWAVALGDVVIAVAAILGVYWVKGGGTNSTSVVSIITSGFTAIGTLTTAYFGIKAVANTANTTTLNPGNAGVTPPGTTVVPAAGPPSATDTAAPQPPTPAPEPPTPTS